MSKRDHYEVLGVSREADAATLKKAYRKLARRYHPDTCDETDAATRFKEATEAYAVLGDAEKRARYDVGGHAAVDGRGAGFDPSAFSDFGDLFGAFRDIFGVDVDGFGGGGRRVQRGRDFFYEVALTFEEAALGTEKELTFHRVEECGDCGGSGAAKGSGRRPCGDCGGRGQVVFRQGFFSVARTCARCAGAGTVVENPCSECDGEGRVEAERTLRAKIPAGIDAGQRIRLGGEGEAGAGGGPRGDLHVSVSIEPHEYFERHGADVHIVLPLAFPQVALGASVTIPTLEGDQEIDVPAGTEAGQVIRIRGKGIRRLGRSGHGDLHVHVHVRTPKSLSSKQKKMLREYASAVDEQYELGEDKSFLDRVREIFG